MTSILKVDTIQDTAGNNIINESSDTITIGASGDTITIPSGATLSNLGTASGFGTNTPYFRAYQSGTSQNLGSAGDWTKIQMNTETVDSASAYDTTDYRFTPLKAGYYFISGAVVTYNSNYTYRWQQIAVYKNGSEYNRSTIDYNNSNCYGAGITVNALVYLNGSTDYVELYCRAYANGNTVGIDEASTSSYWSGFFLTT
jgi:hypothetical protein